MLILHLHCVLGVRSFTTHVSIDLCNLVALSLIPTGKCMEYDPGKSDTVQFLSQRPLNRLGPSVTNLGR